jgi:branched-chain amino acid transport system ATP-binding protein
VLEIEGLTAHHGLVRALSDVTLRVQEGSITAVLGANGAGKTTLLRVISGLVRPTAGRIVAFGRDITALPADQIARSGIAHVPEGGGVIPELTVAENLRLGALWRSDKADRVVALREMLELFPPLAPRLTKAAGTLSGGERQMLAIGRGLMGRPRMLLLDEPSLGLAPLVAAKIMAVLRDLRAETGLTVLLVEQNAHSALSVSDHGFVLGLGELVASDDAATLLADEQLSDAYLGLRLKGAE